jgi:hypothetical protein
MDAGKGVEAGGGQLQVVDAHNIDNSDKHTQQESQEQDGLLLPWQVDSRQHRDREDKDSKVSADVDRRRGEVVSKEIHLGFLIARLYAACTGRH